MENTLDLLKPKTTKRLYFRLLNHNDIDNVHRQFSDLDMCKYTEPPCTLEESREIIEHYKDPIGKGYLRYAMIKKDSNEFIGTLGYHYWDIEHSQVEIGYDIWKDFWKQGYMSEALPILLEICFNHLKVNCVYILTHPENIASMNSVKKFDFEESKPLRDTGEIQRCFKLLHSQFNK